jgi:hypothetical protein
MYYILWPLAPLEYKLHIHDMVSEPRLGFPHAATRALFFSFLPRSIFFPSSPPLAAVGVPDLSPARLAPALACASSPSRPSVPARSRSQQEASSRLFHLHSRRPLRPFFRARTPPPLRWESIPSALGNRLGPASSGSARLVLQLEAVLAPALGIDLSNLESISAGGRPRPCPVW